VFKVEKPRAIKLSKQSAILRFLNMRANTAIIYCGLVKTFSETPFVFLPKQTLAVSSADILFLAAIFHGNVAKLIPYKNNINPDSEVLFSFRLSSKLFPTKAIQLTIETHPRFVLFIKSTNGFGLFYKIPIKIKIKNADSECRQETVSFP